MRKLLAFLALVVFAAGCSTGDDAVVQGSDYQFTSPGGKTRLFYDGADRKVLPDLHGESLQQPGKQLALSDYRGKVIVINIWGSWCGPCRTEAPDLAAEVAKFGGQAQMFGIDVQDNYRQAALDFLHAQRLNYPSLYDPPGRSLLALGNYPASAVPTTIVVDKQRRVAAVYLEALTRSDIDPLLRRLTAEKVTAAASPR